MPPSTAWIDGLGALGPLVFIAVYALAAVAFVPGSLLTLAAGAIFGLGAAPLYTLVAATLGASLAFLVSRYVARGASSSGSRRNPSFAAIDRAIGARGPQDRVPAAALAGVSVQPAQLRARRSPRALRRLRWSHRSACCPARCSTCTTASSPATSRALAGGATPARGAGYYVVLALGLVATVAVTAFVTRAARARSPRSPMSDGGACRSERRDDRSDVEPDDRAQPRPASRTCIPPSWRNPAPAARYNLVVIGAGTAGLVSAAGAAGLGATVALVERAPDGRRLPERRLRAVEGAAARGRAPGTRRAAGARSARRVARRRRRFRARDGAHARAAREHQPSTTAPSASGGSASTCFSARRASPAATRSRSTARALRFARAVIATGARAAVPPIPGLAEAGYLTNETIFELEPRCRARLGVIGARADRLRAGAGVRAASASRSRCSIATRACLPREDADAAAIVAARARARRRRARRRREHRASRGDAAATRSRFVSQSRRRRRRDRSSTRSWSRSAARPTSRASASRPRASRTTRDGRRGRRPPAHHEPAHLRRAATSPGAVKFTHAADAAARDRHPERALPRPHASRPPW